MEYPPGGITRKYIAAFVKVFVLAAFLVAAVQSSTLAGYDYTIRVHNNTGQTLENFSVIVNDGAIADFGTVYSGNYVSVDYFEAIYYVSVVYTSPGGDTVTRQNLPIYGADVYVR